MIWIGPTPEQIRQLGAKHTARTIAESVGVPIIPGSHGLLKTSADALKSAETVGFPVMLKSSAGGGGIGLKRCDDATELAQAFADVQRLSKANFDDDKIILEHFVPRARHIEVQIIGDGTGRILLLGERDCSLQRRHQKVVEESPAPSLSLDTTKIIRSAAAKIGAAVKYRNVGTVEFLTMSMLNVFTSSKSTHGFRWSTR